MTQQAGGVDAGLHVGQLEGDGLVLDDGPVELLALLGVLEGVLVGSAGDADRLGADRWPAGLERGHRRLARRRATFASAGDSLVQPLLAPE